MSRYELENGDFTDSEVKAFTIFVLICAACFFGCTSCTEEPPPPSLTFEGDMAYYQGAEIDLNLVTNLSEYRYDSQRHYAYVVHFGDNEVLLRRMMEKDYLRLMSRWASVQAGSEFPDSGQEDITDMVSQYLEEVREAR